MHRFPKEPEVRRQWTQFVRRHRIDFNLSAYTVLCSQRFAESCYSRSAISSLPDFNKEGTRLRLNKDAVPSISNVQQQQTIQPSRREKRG